MISRKVFSPHYTIAHQNVAMITEPTAAEKRQQCIVQASQRKAGGQLVSVDVDFGITDPGLFQSTGIDVGWEITWSPIDDTHFVAVSFFSNFGGSQLVRVSRVVFHGPRWDSTCWLGCTRFRIPCNGLCVHTFRGNCRSGETVEGDRAMRLRVVFNEKGNILAAAPLDSRGPYPSPASGRRASGTRARG